MSGLIKRLAACAALYVFLVSGVNAQKIDFEALPNGTPADQTPISDQYLWTHFVSFELEDGTTPYLEKRGSQDVGQGFKNNVLGGQPDVEADGYTGQFGNYFLRIGTVNLSEGPVPDMLINYVWPVAAASGEIWDIDGTGFASETERWRVTAYDSEGAVLQIIDSPEGVDDGPGSLDGLPWAWAFELETASIQQIRLTFTGTKQSLIGLAFDNFYPSSAAATWPKVDVDVLPGDADNIVYPNRAGRPPVAILGSGEFDATQVDPATLRFGLGKAEPVTPATISDVDGAFGLDTTVSFDMPDAAIGCADTEVSLTGETYSGDPFIGTDTINATDCSGGACHKY